MKIATSKKIIIVKIVEILEQYSNIDNPLTHNSIIAYLKNMYNIDCERKTIGRNIICLREAGYDIISTGKGVYLNSRLFEESELRLLIDSVLASRHINNNHSQKLIEKLNYLGGYYFKERNKNIKVLDWAKCNNFNFFLNVEMIDEAIEKDRKIEFVYNAYGKDKKLHPCRDYTYVVNPYHMMLNNQRYYLIGNVDKYDNITNFRVDRMTNINILEQSLKRSKDLPKHLNITDIAKGYCESPYIYAGEIESIEMVMNKKFINDVVDWFGIKFRVKELDDNQVKVYLKANPQAVQYWALQYGTNIEVVSPESLRLCIINDIKTMAKKYNIKE